MRIALYQPDIPQNTGTILRLAACLNVECDIIAPAGFDMSDRSLRRAGLDYLNHVNISRHASFEAFQAETHRRRERLILLTTKAELPYCGFNFTATDCLLLGRESSGVPVNVHDAADERLMIPMSKNMRSINVAMSAAMVLGEALRQTGHFAERPV
ncbi:MAG: tRNA (cytidine(34)-2'-O)-methyltransferase [Hyphomicrobiales bacterium]|nr:tRNA (cytidine(34)-2'-O)-methyltransferase [Hyphomicrobiales bacterium]